MNELLAMSVQHAHSRRQFRMGARHRRLNNAAANLAGILEVAQIQVQYDKTLIIYMQALPGTWVGTWLAV